MILRSELCCSSSGTHAYLHRKESDYGNAVLHQRFHKRSIFIALPWVSNSRLVAAAKSGEFDGGALSVYAATPSVRLYRNGKTKMAAWVHCSPPQPKNSFLSATSANPATIRIYTNRPLSFGSLILVEASLAEFAGW